MPSILRILLSTARIALSRASWITNPSLASLIAGFTSSFHSNFPYFLCASYMPRTSPGTAIARPPKVIQLWHCVICSLDLFTISSVHVIRFNDGKRLMVSCLPKREQTPFSNFHQNLSKNRQFCRQTKS